MKAAVIAVGSEMLGPERLDTNSLRLTTLFERYGIALVAKSVIGDDPTAIANEIRRRLHDVELLVITGGLGPTADDVTRAATASALGRSIAIDERLVEHIRSRFAQLGRKMPEVNRRQAEVIAGAEVLANELGSAPGLKLVQDQTSLFLFPGVPRELRGMIENHLEPWIRQSSLAEYGIQQGIERRVLKVAGLPESALEEKISPAYEQFGREAFSVLASPGEIRIYAVAQGAEEERNRGLIEMQQILRRLIGTPVFTDQETETLESVVGSLLTDAGQTLTTAESCTGGLLAERLTRVAGSSAYFNGGVVTYSNALKNQLLGVPMALIETHGAVSEPVARAMARGVRERYNSDFGVGITGVAGPGGGSAEKPVGTVHVASAGPAGEQHRLLRLPGDRQQVRQQSSQLALDMLRRQLLGGSS